VNYQWMEEKLTAYYSLLRDYAVGGAPGGWWPENETKSELRRKEPTARQILKRLDPDLADFESEGLEGPYGAMHAIERGLGILADQEEWAANLAPEGPVIAADQLHPWVWASASTLWDSGHYRQAVQAAATAINAKTQAKLGRRDVSDDKLMQDAFSENPPQPGQPRLRCPGDPADQTIRSRQRGALQFAVGCFFAIRNPASHEEGEWEPQVAIECLAALSVLARWIDEWEVVSAA